MECFWKELNKIKIVSCKRKNNFGKEWSRRKKEGYSILRGVVEIDEKYVNTLSD